MKFRDHQEGTFMIYCKVKTPKGMVLETEIPTLGVKDGEAFMTALNTAMIAPVPKRTPPAVKKKKTKKTE